MRFSRLLPLILLLGCGTICKLEARPPLIIHVAGPKASAPYTMNNEPYTAEKLKQYLTVVVKEFPEEFSKPSIEETWEGGMVVMPDEDASFTAVMQLLQLLKECDVDAYSIYSKHKPDPKVLTQLWLPVHSAQLHVTHEPIEPAPPTNKISPQQRIQEITEKMGGLRRK